MWKSTSCSNGSKFNATKLKKNLTSRIITIHLFASNYRHFATLKSESLPNNEEQKIKEFNHLFILHQRTSAWSFCVASTLHTFIMTFTPTLE